MLRLAHRILSQPLQFDNAISTAECRTYKSIIMRVVTTCPKIIIDNVASTYFSPGWGSETSIFWAPSLHCIKSPFEEAWCEYNVPESYFEASDRMAAERGDFDGLGNAEEYGKDCRRGGQLGFSLSQYFNEDTGHDEMLVLIVRAIDGTPVMEPFIIKAILESDGAVLPGNILMRHASGHSKNNDGRGFGTMCAPVFFALSLMNAKNRPAEIDVTESVQPDAKWQRRMRVPEIRYRILDVHLSEPTASHCNLSSLNPIDRALHLVRGHYVTYSEDKPLFGRIAGTFWIPPHARGDIKQGAVVKDYSVSPQ